ncbi:unnamed protein product [Blepharisma stoltei]|uniref:Uncharacterized protein n=1 Tax=Blepharisma stoltei TaxID=1481888 RepID=A0AAU9JNT5_9CILI|nr:unnamed protein product [Blepharisma stoltei]
MFAAYLFRGIMIGDSQSGKSSLAHRFLRNRFIEEQKPTIGVEFAYKIIGVDGIAIKLQLWDTAGREEFRTTTRSYYRSVAAIIFVYDVTRRESFEHLNARISEAIQNAPSTAVAILVGNKVDKEGERNVLFEEGQKFASEHQMIYLETSAKTGWNVDNIFHFVSAEILARIRNGLIDVEKEGPGIKLNEQY